MLAPAAVLFFYGLGALAAPSMHIDVADPNSFSGSFSVQAQRNPKFVRNGRNAMHKVLAKYNLPMPSGLTKRDGSVPAIPATQDVEYVAPVIIGGKNGKKGQTMMLDFDTGSSDLWVFSSELPAEQVKNHPNVFNPKKSNSWKPMKGSTWNITYTDGSGASGTVGTDYVWIGGIYYKNQAVEIATQVSDAFIADDASDGLLGLALDSINTVEPKQVKTFSTNVMPYMKQKLFTADLRLNETGSYDFGYIDHKKYSSSSTLKYVPIISENGFWEYPAPKYIINGKTYDDGNTTAIADTGTTLILVSNEIAGNYYKSVEGATYDSENEGYVFPCNSKLPQMSLSIGQYMVPINGKYLNYGPVDDKHPDICYGGMQGYDTSGFDRPMYIYGDIFFKQYFSVFDMGKQRFGFAEKKSRH